MNKYDSIYDLMTNPEHILTLDRERNEDKEVVEACIHNSEANFSRWLQEMGFMGDSKLEAGWGIHHALHEAFDTCDIDLVAMQLAIACATQQQKAAQDAMSAFFMVGIMFGATFALEAQKRGLPTSLGSNDAAHDDVLKLIDKWERLTKPGDVSAIPFPPAVDSIIQDMVNELNASAHDATVQDSLDMEAGDAMGEEEGPTPFDQECSPDKFPGEEPDFNEGWPISDEDDDIPF